MSTLKICVKIVEDREYTFKIASGIQFIKIGFKFYQKDLLE